MAYSGSLKVVDLFCGAGGLSLGFKRAGWDIVLAIDSDKACVETYRQNLGNHVECLKITEDMTLPPAQVIIGGPPCQGFSSAGLRQVGDKRNSLISLFAKLVAKHRPAAFMFENVEGFLTAEKGKRVLDLLEPLVSAGYRIHLRKINAANFGVPQLRKRVIAIGGLGWEPYFPEPTHRAFGAPGARLVASRKPLSPVLSHALNDLPPASNQPPGIVPDHYFRPISDDRLARMRALAPGQTMRDLPANLWHDSYRRRANRRVKDGTPTECRGGAPAGIRRLRYDEPSKAITGGAQGEFIHPEENRFLTLRECARIQTFPDDFLFHGSSSERSSQIGNAVPPILAETFATQLLSDIALPKPVQLEGALLSFVASPSNGLSPILRFVTELVETKFFSRYPEPEQLKLWR